MLGFIAKKIFGTRNDRILKSMRPIVNQVNELEAEFQKMSDEKLQAQTARFKERIARGESLDSLLPETFAVVREASVRTLGMRHFDVQIIGGVVLHRGMIAEMKTGEGKTLCATLAVYLNALSGKGVHVVTVNDYLASRDAEWMGAIYKFLDMSVGVIVPQIDPEERAEAYRCDIVYGQNNEFGFDYLRDNMKFDTSEMAQRGHNYAIVDEVDSILIDEARTPLIISGPAEDATDKYYTADKVIPKLKEDIDYEIDLKSKQPTLTEEGVSKIEKLLGVENLYDPQYADMVHHVNQALKAHKTFTRDVDYVVRDGQVIIVDEFTGRMMHGRRWSDGLHQAVEAKEGLNIARENQTLASITFQNYFRMYDKLAGMTGTADTEAVEFKKIYDLEVVVIPTNEPMIRNDKSDLVFKTIKEKYNAAADDIEKIYRTGQPVLVGTVSIEQSEELSKQLKKKGIPHNVLNAKHHEREAEIVAQAGRLHAVTIATNMAGRGTDIVLGGNPELLALKETASGDKSDPEFKEKFEKYRKICAEEKKKVIELGGLYIVGTERHESRRIDNQLRGRSGRQGDPGASQFYVSLEDDLMKRFGGERVQKIMNMFKMEEGITLEGGMISKSIENAQRKVEGHHFDIRKHLLEYDDVMNKQRQVIYAERAQVLRNEGLKERVLDMADDLIEDAITELYREGERKTESELSELRERFAFLFNEDCSLKHADQMDQQEVFDLMRKAVRPLYDRQVERMGKDQFDEIQRHIYLESLDYFWKNHLLEMDHLKEGIGLRSYGQKNPLHEYQREGFLLFEKMIQTMKEDIVRKLFAIRPLTPEEIKQLEEAEQRRRLEQERLMSLNHAEFGEEADPGQKKKIKAKDPEAERKKLNAARRARRRRKK